MTTYYLSASQGQTGVSVTASTGVAEATSAPTADVVVTFANIAVSRGSVMKILEGIRNYLHTDANNPAGPVIPFGAR
jgi:hypothetical protein